jgi:hypothetical protein
VSVLYEDEDCIERAWTRHGVTWARRGYIGEPSCPSDYFHFHDDSPTAVVAVLAGFWGWYAHADGRELAHVTRFDEALRIGAEHALATCCALSPARTEDQDGA